MKKILLSITALGLMTLGCDKKLDRIDPNNLTTEAYWKTKDQAYAGVTAIYNALINDGSYT